MDLAAAQLSPPSPYVRFIFIRSRWVWWAYVLVLAALCVHLYRHPAYEMDSVSYMGNALLMEETDPAKIHQRVYAEVARMPAATRDDFEGTRAGGSEDQNRSRHERAVNAYRAAEFFPFFAIRPLYVQTLYYVSKTGLGLTRASVLISVVSFLGLGLLCFAWMRTYTPDLLAGFMAIGVMLTPPLVTLGKYNTSDALANLSAFLAVYLIFEKDWLTAGLSVLLTSIYFRTDNVVLAGPVLLMLWWQHRMELWKALTLSAVALGSALTISRLAGDYGWKMLYFRNFIGTPLAPAEVPVSFTWHDYVSAWRMGITGASASFFLPFLLLGIPGILFCRKMRLVGIVAIASAALHFAILPNWVERWFGVYYLVMPVCAASALFQPRFPQLSGESTDV
jgi:hypothetical protein